MALWRNMRAEDLSVIRALHERQQEKLGYRFRLPDLEKALLAVVEERSGEVKGGLYFERVAEVMAVSDDPKFMLRGLANDGAFEFFLKARGFTEVQAMVPKSIAEANTELLRKKKFYTVGSDLAQFVRLL
jgi:hypothetical protein